MIHTTSLQAALVSASRRRDVLLATAAAGIATGFAFHMCESFFELLDALRQPYPGESQASAVLQVIGAAGGVAAFAWAATALLGPSAQRRRRLAAAMAGVAASFATSAGGFAWSWHFYSYATRFPPKWGEAAFGAQAGGTLLVALAFATASFGLLSTKRRWSLLALASFGLAAGYVVLTAAAMLMAAMDSDFTTSAYVAGIRTTSCGDALTAVAALTGAVGFLRAENTVKRDGTLGLASAIATGAFLVSAAGSFLAASATSASGRTSVLVAAAWLAAFGTLVFALSFAVGTLALSAPRSSAA
jgi:hypothetical protein